MIKKLKIYVLRALLARDGLPLRQTELIGAVLILGRPLGPTDSDVELAIKQLSEERLILGVGRQLRETDWTLTDAGEHEARKL